jgi:hypothetical protein
MVVHGAGAGAGHLLQNQPHAPRLTGLEVAGVGDFPHDVNAEAAWPDLVERSRIDLGRIDLTTFVLDLDPEGAGRRLDQVDGDPDPAVGS